MYSKKNFLVPMKIKLFQSLFSPRILTGYLYGFWMGLSMGLRYTAFSSGLEVGLCEGFILITNHSLNMALVLIGFFILIADAPFINSETYYVLIRSGGTSWRLSMITYILVQLIIYEALIFSGSIFPCLLRGNFTMEWSETIAILSGPVPKIAILDYDLPVLDNWMLTAWNAPTALLHSFFLTTFYCLFLGLTIFTGNINSAFPIGNLIAIGIHFIGMLAMSEFVPIYWISMAAHGMLQFHIPGREILSLSASYALFFTAIIIVLLILKKISHFTNYNSAISQKTW